MTINTKALRERLPSFDYVIYTNREGIEPAADGEYVLAADAHERLEAAADRLAALEAENQRLRETLEWYAHPILPYSVTQFHEPRSAVHADGGHRAREALAAGGGK